MKENETQIQIIDSTELIKSEIDIQIATAKQYPRDVSLALKKIKEYATIDVETAEDCFYALRRGGDLIDGPSVRLAEIFANCWGNLRIQTRIVGNDGRKITANGMCHDLETNVAVSFDVDRRITDKNGRTYSEDLQVVTGNAASSIAFRNAIFKVIPKAITNKITKEIEEFAFGKTFDLEKGRNNAIEYYKRLNISIEQILMYFNVKSVDELKYKQVVELRKLRNTIEQENVDVNSIFPKLKQPTQSKKVDKIEAAMMESEQPKTELF